jgi:hypothetical protein
MQPSSPVGVKAEQALTEHPSILAHARLLTQATQQYRDASQLKAESAQLLQRCKDAFVKQVQQNITPDHPHSKDVADVTALTLMKKAWEDKAFLRPTQTAPSHPPAKKLGITDSRFENEAKRLFRTLHRVNQEHMKKPLEALEQAMHDLLSKSIASAKASLPPANAPAS